MGAGLVPYVALEYGCAAATWRGTLATGYPPAPVGWAGSGAELELVAAVLSPLLLFFFQITTPATIAPITTTAPTAAPITAPLPPPPLLPPLPQSTQVDRSHGVVSHHEFDVKCVVVDGNDDVLAAADDSVDPNVVSRVSTSIVATMDPDFTLVTSTSDAEMPRIEAQSFFTAFLKLVCAELLEEEYEAKSAPSNRRSAANVTNGGGLDEGLGDGDGQTTVSAAVSAARQYPSVVPQRFVHAMSSAHSAAVVMASQCAP